MTSSGLAIAVLTALLSSLALAAPSRGELPPWAERDDTMGTVDCVFSGLSGQAGGGVDAIHPDVADGNALDVDSGSFTFDGTATCVGADTASDEEPGGPGIWSGQAVVLPTSVRLEASGEYANLICGTGTVAGDARIYTDNGDRGASDPVRNGAQRVDIDIDLSFHIYFTAGVGVLHGEVEPADDAALDEGYVAASKPDSIVDWTVYNIVHSGGVAGAVDILPGTPPMVGTGGDCITANAESFTVAGAFTATIGGSRNDEPADSHVPD